MSPDQAQVPFSLDRSGYSVPACASDCPVQGGSPLGETQCAAQEQAGGWRVIAESETGDAINHSAALQKK